MARSVLTLLLMLAAVASETAAEQISCAGIYPQHLQGVCVGGDTIFWSFTDQLVKTDREGKLLKKIPVADHHGDLCYLDGKIYVAVNLGKFNDPEGNADSWVYVYDAETLTEILQHEVQEVFHGAGGIGTRGDRFFVVGGLPAGVQENYVYEFDRDFQFVKKHTIASGWTRLGIQTATFAEGRWWFGCYGNPKILLVTDPQFRLLGRYEFDCSLGIVGIGGGRFYAAGGQCKRDVGCSGTLKVAVPDPLSGLRYEASDEGEAAAN